MSNSVVPELLCYFWEPPVLQDEQVLKDLLYSIVSVYNTTLLYTQKSVKRVDFMFHFLTTNGREREHAPLGWLQAEQ